MKVATLLALAAALPCSAQRIYVHSPLTRVDPSGQVLKADRGQRPPRDILSPGVPRNAYSSLRIVVEMDTPGAYRLDIGQNPENAVQATLYREAFIETAHGFIPDGLNKVEIPYRGFPTDFRLKGQRVVTFWLDMWVDRNAEVDRIKIEPQLYVDTLDDWVIYPMEVRVQVPVVPDMRRAGAGALPPPTDPSDSVVRAPVQAAICGGKPEPAGPSTQEITVRHLLRRNVLQHLALVKDPVATRAALAKATGMPDAAWCAEPVTPPSGPEWYLRFRDAIYRAAGATE